MPFTPKDWRNAPDSSTPISAEALEDLEARLGEYTDTQIGTLTPTSPSTGEKAGLAGTSGTPSGSNRFVTDADARNSNARAPLAHAASHGAQGSDKLSSYVTGASLTAPIQVRDVGQ